MKTILLTVLTLMISAGSVFAQSWTEVPGIATDIAVGADGSVWIVGSAQRGHLIFRWDDGAWIKAPRSHWLRIAAGPKDALYAINNENKVFRLKNNDWQTLPGTATDIAVGADGSVFVIGSESKNHRVYQWNDGAWSDFPGSNYKRIAVGPQGQPFVVSHDNNIYRWHYDEWKQIDGTATDIAIGPGGEVYIIGDELKNRSIFRLDDGAWTKLPGEDFRRVSVGSKGMVWATRGDTGKVFRLQ